MKASKLQRFREAVLGILIFVAWVVLARFIAMALARLGLAPPWLVELLSGIVAFGGALVGFVGLVGLVDRLYERLESSRDRLEPMKKLEQRQITGPR